MTPISDYKYLGLLAFALLIVGLLFVVVKWPHGTHLTFSQHVAKQRSSILYYIALFSVTLPLLMLFFIGWFVPTFNVAAWFSVFLIISCICQYACVFIPETGGWKSTYHRLLSGISGICLVPLLIILLWTPSLDLTEKYMIVGGLAIMASVLYDVISHKKEQYEPTYIHQAVFYCAFFVPIVAISYL